jgi:ribosomal protein S18 acetylase RimI-like enzyme
LDRVIADLDPESKRAITLWVFEANERAQRLYRSAGFEASGQRRVEDEYRAQEIQMRRISTHASGGANSNGNVSHAVDSPVV